MIDVKLYTYLRAAADGAVVLPKALLPSQGRICEKLGIKSPKTLRTHLQHLLDKGYIEETDTEFKFSDADVFDIRMETLQFLIDTSNKAIIELYVALLGKNEFTIMELNKELEMPVRQVRNGLQFLKLVGLLDFEVKVGGVYSKK